jgi:transposase
MPWLARVRQEGHLVTRVVTPRLSPEGIKSEASWVQLGYSHARAVPEKYKAHKTKLIGGKLQMRSNNNNQIHNLKSQNITKNIRDILLKLNKNEIINFSDLDT